MANTLRTLFPPKPTFTEENVLDQSGKVFLVTGGSGGLGKELVKMLYSKNAKVYVAARSESKALAAIDEAQRHSPQSTDSLAYLHLDLDDLTTVRTSANLFLSKESRLHVLWNNAGVMVPPQGSKTTQGYELQLGTNNVAPMLFTRLLYPALAEAAKTSPENSVRVVWVSSSAIRLAPKPAIDFSNMDYQRDEGPWVKYRRSKAANVIQAYEFARRSRESKDGIIHMSLDPGNLNTDLQRSMPKFQEKLVRLISYEPRFGAYTELFAGLHPGIKEENNGGWVASFGRLVDCPRKDLLDEKLGRDFWDWTEEELKPYL
ncbi:hypothetical protein FDECE_4019 [Fusarium decemcellulare]|nr:hypothetical protein FDECE_4019 [Fusarium decemcellulare]